jgi:hypothetical protein
MPGEVEIEEWKCLAELIGNAFDDFNESVVFIILEAAVRRCRFSLCASIASAPELNAFAIAVAACPLLALLLSVERVHSRGCRGVVRRLADRLLTRRFA